MRHCAARLLLSLMLAALGTAHAEWPERPIKLIVPVGSGASPDRIARVIADRLSRDLGQGVVVENLTGGGGLIASRTAVRAAPDGYTLFFGGVGALVTDPYTVKDLGYDPDRDFVYISHIYEEGSLAIAVHPDVPAKTLPGLLALAKQQPGKLSYGTTSVNFIIYFGQWLNRLAGTDMLAIAYKSPAQQFQDVLAGRIQMIISSPPTLDAHMKSGRLRVLAVDGAKRFPLWPDVPNVGDTFPGFRLSGTGVLVGPKGVPEEAARKLRAGMKKIVEDKSYQDALLQMGFTVDGTGTSESIQEYLNERRAIWRKVFDGLGVKPK